MTQQVRSFLDTDFYEFLMQQIFVAKFNNVHGRMVFKCRNMHLPFDDYVNRLKKAIVKFENQRFTNEELSYLSSLKTKHDNFIFKSYYLGFLSKFVFDPKYIDIYRGKRNELCIEIEGPLPIISFYEVLLLRSISFIYSELNYSNENISTKLPGFFEEIEHTFDSCPDLKFADFGTRRAFSFDTHSNILNKIRNRIVGTSNMFFARKFNIKPIGTMAHKYIQTFQGLDTNSVEKSQQVAFETWANFYRGDLGIALSDTLGDNKFFKDFDLYFMKLFDGVRNDSGDPFEWGERVIKMYRDNGINPLTKNIIFSNGLDFDLMKKLHTYFSKKINVSFGIGTNLTNNFNHNIVAPNIVIKLVEINDNPVAKLSQDDGKQMCLNDTYLKYLKMINDCI